MFVYLWNKLWTVVRDPLQPIEWTMHWVILFGSSASTTSQDLHRISHISNRETYLKRSPSQEQSLYKWTCSTQVLSHGLTNYDWQQSFPPLPLYWAVSRGLTDGLTAAPHLLRRCHRNRWWHCCAWQRQCWAWQMAAQADESSTRTQACFQPREVWCESFFSHILRNCIQQNGAQRDPKKVEAISSMPPPKKPQELQRFLWMTTYLSPFIPSLLKHTAPPWELLKKDTEFTWNTTYQEAFDALKDKVCTDTTLWYFDAEKPVTSQVDASQKGLGAALLQDGCPVTFASKALIPTKQCYANIER